MHVHPRSYELASPQTLLGKLHLPMPEAVTYVFSCQGFVKELKLSFWTPFYARGLPKWTRNYNHSYFNKLRFYVKNGGLPLWQKLSQFGLKSSPNAAFCGLSIPPDCPFPRPDMGKRELGWGLLICFRQVNLPAPLTPACQDCQASHHNPMPRAFLSKCLFAEHLF